MSRALLFSIIIVPLVLFGAFSLLKEPQTVSTLRADSVPATYAKWQEKVQEIGPQEAYSAFKRENTSDDFGKRHLGAHIFGEVVFQEVGVDGIGACDASFEFGCYHGFFNAAVYR